MAGGLTGPYISQFFWQPVPVNSTNVDQQFRTAATGIDYMTTYDEWLIIQTGVPPYRLWTADPQVRYIHNGRGLAEWVHYDFLYQAYHNAAHLSRSRYFWLLHYRAGLLRRTGLGQHPCQRVQSSFELVVIRFTQRSLARVVQYAVEFFQIHVDTFALHQFNRSRNLRWSGKPIICLTGRVCSKVAARCPRPAVVPITCQLAAR